MRSTMDPSIALPSKSDEIIILRDHLPGGARKIDLKCWHITTEIANMENQIIRQISLLTPKNPPHSERRKSKFMP